MISKYFLIFLIFVCFSYAQDYPEYSIQRIDEKLAEHADAVVRFSLSTVKVHDLDKLIRTSRRVVTVYNEKGVKSILGDLYYDKYIKIRSVDALVLDKNGNIETRIKRKNFLDYSNVDEGTLYTDSRVLLFPKITQQFPYTIIFNYKIETTDTAALPSWRPIIFPSVSIEKDEYIVQDLANLLLHHKEINFDGYEIKSNISADNIQYTLTDYHARPIEQLMPHYKKIFPYLITRLSRFHFKGIDGYAHNWKEFGNWMFSKILEGRQHVMPSTKRKILEITSNIEDPIEKAEIIYNYVQQQTRYISVQVGIGGIQPIEALEVDKYKYGDCKGLTNYTQSLLEIAGVESYYCIVESGSKIEDLDDDFPTLEQGNHIIMAVPNGKELIWIDCTSKIHPFGFLGDFTDNRKVLLVDKNNSRIVKTPEYINSTNLQNITAKINILENRNITIEANLISKGTQYDNRFFIEKKAPFDIKEFYKNQWNYVNNLSVDSYQFDNIRDSVQFKETLKLSIDEYLFKNGSDFILIPNVLNQNHFIPNRYINRYYPFEIQRGYLDEDEYEFEIPNEYDIKYIPEKIELKTKFGSYFIEILQHGNSLIYKRVLSINKGYYSKEEYDYYRSFRKKISKFDKLKIILTPKQ